MEGTELKPNVFLVLRVNLLPLIKSK